MKIFIVQRRISLDRENYGNLVFFALFLIGLVVIFSYGIGNVSATSGDTIYVNGSSGHDSSAGTSWLYAKKSIKNATETATADGTVNIANGNYTGINNTQITLNKNINIIGQSKTSTIINGTGTNWIFHINTGIKVNIRNVLLTNGTANNGGSIVNYGDLTVFNTSFTGNTATASNGLGGAIYSSGHLNVTNSVFTNNSATVFGGAICIDSNILDLSNSVFTKNTAGYYGGAISNIYGVLDVKNSIFTSNNAISNGGAIYSTGGTLTAIVTVSGSNFTSNYADYGGAIYSDSILNVTNSIFKTNTASDTALPAVPLPMMVTLNVNNCNFTDNNASKGVGGAITTAGDLIINKSTFVGNNANGYSGGGAIYNYIKCLVNISGSTFTSNTANKVNGGYGGAIFNYGTLNVTTSNFNSNKATEYGGAICNDDTLNATSCNFIGNSVTAVTNYGGAIYNYGTSNVHFNRIVGNIANIASAIYNEHGTVDASLNWWGSNSGPSTGNVVNTTVSSWLVLKLSANPTNIPNNSYSTITADLRYTNHGILAGGYLPNGIPVKFTSTLGTISQASTINGMAQSTLKSGIKAGTSNISAYLDNQKLQTSITVKDTIPPTVVLTSPTNGATGFSKTANIGIKFSENIKAGTNWSKIVVKDKYGQAVHITAWISGTTIFIKTNPRAANSWYIVTIPASAVKDLAGNNLLKAYTFRFKTTILNYSLSFFEFNFFKNLFGKI